MTTAQRMWLRAREVAADTGTSLPTVYRSARAGWLKGTKINRGRMWRFHLDDVRAWMMSEADVAPCGSTDRDD